MATLNLTIKVNSADKSEYAASGNANKSLTNAARLLKALASGSVIGSVDASVSATNPVKATGTLTLDTVIATDVATVAGITFTGTDTPTTNLHFDTDAGSDALIAASLVAAINAHPTTSQVVTASASGDVVTVTANVAGPIGNLVPIASVDSTITASAAYLASGAGGSVSTPVTYGR